MLRKVPVGLIVDDLHVTGDVPAGLEGMARRAPHGHPLPGLRRLAGRDVPEVRENVAVVTKSAHASML